jgi:hypothetical protein
MLSISADKISKGDLAGADPAKLVAPDPHGRFEFQKKCSYEEWAGGRSHAVLNDL